MSKQVYPRFRWARRADVRVLGASAGGLALVGLVLTVGVPLVLAGLGLLILLLGIAALLSLRFRVGRADNRPVAGFMVVIGTAMATVGVVDVITSPSLGGHTLADRMADVIRSTVDRDSSGGGAQEYEPVDTTGWLGSSPAEPTPGGQAAGTGLPSAASAFLPDRFDTLERSVNRARVITLRTPGAMGTTSREVLTSPAFEREVDARPTPTRPAATRPAPSDPAPTDPAPTDPTDPTPTDPTPTDPAPTDPTDPTPTDPAPTDPTDPTPTDPTPTPTDPTPTEETPVGGGTAL